ncbi:MAG: amino acid ABC transporter ATP-binding protein [Candidatus Delongbacteria bacterium]|jgi:polar amino acid transport system ATP-binding protein|nr:amino acid ABC transporter ATP-binding protein [Candidatus Delongbacteria bacterium]
MRLRIKNLTKQYDGQKAIDNISLELDDISSLVLIGPSGSGKTTLLRILAGLEVPEHGEIQINDHIIHINDHMINFDENNLLKYRKKIGVVFQAFNLFPHWTALENITYPLIKVHNFSFEEAEDRANTLLKRFSLDEHKNKKPLQLSGGQQQRIALCRAASLKPEILFLDEPTSALDPEFTVEVLDLIHELQEEGIEFILVTHEMGFAASSAKHILFLDEGRIISQGNPAQIFTGENRPDRVVNFMNKILKYETEK